MSNGKNPHVIALSNFRIPRLAKPKKGESNTVQASELIKAAVAVCCMIYWQQLISRQSYFTNSHSIIVFVQSYYLIRGRELMII